MNFFEHQARAKSQTRRLVILFALAVAAIIAAIDGVIVFALAANVERGAATGWGAVARENAGLMAVTSLVVLAVILLASLFKTASLRGGGGAVARALGAIQVSSETRNPQLRRLRNVIEEIAIASGVPVPEIYLLEGEPGINAFASGYSPADAAVTVTRGCLDKLSRDELQGVIAHEFSHILNGDMRLNIRLMGVLFGILVIAIVAREIFSASSRSRSSSRKVGNGGAIVLAALAIWIIGSIGQFFGRLIKASVSRQREFLADASAVQFTRQNHGIAGALKKIGGLSAGSKFQAVQAEEISHMLFGDGVGYSALFATHPPLIERIKRIDPAFKPAEIEAGARKWNQPDYAAEETARDETMGFSTAPDIVQTSAVIAQLGHPSSDDYLHAEAVHAALPEILLDAAADEARAWPLIFALLLDSETDLREQQSQIIEKRFGVAQREAAADLFNSLSEMPAAQRLPLAALAFPNLHRRPLAELMQLLAAVSQLIHADGRVGIFEFCLGFMLRAQVTDALNPARSQIVGSARLADCRDAALALLTALAHCGNDDALRARQAFNAGTNHLFPREALRYQPPTDVVAPLEAALSHLDQLNAPGKQLLIEALVMTLNHDHRVTIGETELLRAVCAGLHCPLPPFRADAA